MARNLLEWWKRLLSGEKALSPVTRLADQTMPEPQHKPTAAGIKMVQEMLYKIRWIGWKFIFHLKHAIALLCRGFLISYTRSTYSAWIRVPRQRTLSAQNFSLLYRRDERKNGKRRDEWSHHMARLLDCGWKKTCLSGVKVGCFVLARTDTAWWHDYAMRREIIFIRGRLKFEGAKHACSMPISFRYFEEDT